MRRRYLIQPGFQARFVGHLMLLVLLATSLTAAVTIGFVRWQDRMERVDLFAVSDEPGTDPVKVDRTDIAFPAILVSAVAGLLLTGLFGLFFSHRLAGPAYKLEKALREHKQGIPQRPVSLRKNDEFHDLAEAVSGVISNGKLSEADEVSSPKKG